MMACKPATIDDELRSVKLKDRALVSPQRCSLGLTMYLYIS